MVQLHSEVCCVLHKFCLSYWSITRASMPLDLQAINVDAIRMDSGNSLICYITSIQAVDLSGYFEFYFQAVCMTFAEATFHVARGLGKSL